MRFTLLLLSVIISVAFTLPLENEDEKNTDANVRNTVLEQLVLDALEDFRETMLTGSDDIPVLDPLELDHLHLDFGRIGLVDSHITLVDIEVRQGSTFVIDDLSISLTSLLLQRYAVEVDVHIPVVEIDAENYDLDVTLFGLRVYGNGGIKLIIREPRIKAKVEVAVSIFGGTSITIRDADVVFELDSFESELTGLFDGNEVIAEFIDDYLALLIPELMVRFQDDISNIINSILIGTTIDINLIGRNTLKPSTVEAFENFKSTIPTNA